MIREPIALPLFLVLLLATAGCSSPVAGQGPDKTGSPGGVGGSGDSGGSGGGGGRPEADPLGWLLDQELWPVSPEASAMDPRCTFRIASSEALARFPVLAWESCGPGCERTEVLQGLFAFANRAALGNDSAGNPFLGVKNVFRSDDVHRLDIRRVVNLRTGTTVAAMQVENGREEYLRCNFTGYPGAPLLVRPTASPAFETSFGLYAHVMPATGTFSYRPPWSDLLDGFSWCSVVTLGGPESPVLGACSLPDRVVGMLEPGSPFVSSVSDRAGYATIASRDGWALWEEARPEDATRLVLWSPETGEAPASEDQPGIFFNVGMGDELLAGVVVRERVPDPDDLDFRDVRLAARPRSPDHLALATSENLAGTGAITTAITTWGDFVAATIAYRREPGEEWDRAAIALARASDWAVRFLDAHPDQSIEPHILGMDDRYLYVGETPGRLGISDDLAAVYRYDLDQFDRLGRD